MAEPPTMWSNWTPEAEVSGDTPEPPGWPAEPTSSGDRGPAFSWGPPVTPPAPPSDAPGFPPPLPPLDEPPSSPQPQPLDLASPGSTRPVRGGDSWPAWWLAPSRALSSQAGSWPATTTTP